MIFVSTVTNNVAAPLPEEKDESLTTSLYRTLKLISGEELYGISISFCHEMIFCWISTLDMNDKLNNDLL